MKLPIALLLSMAMFAQAPVPRAATIGAGGGQTGVDGVIALVSAQMSEQFIIKRLQREGKAYVLTTEDLVKLRKANVSEAIIEVMLDPPMQAQAAPGQTPTPPTPQSAVAPAEAGQSPAAQGTADAKKEGRRGFFGRMKENATSRVKNTGQNTLESTERTVDNTLSSAEDKANQTLGDSQQKADRAVQTRLDSGQQAADSTVQKGTGARNSDGEKKRSAGKR